jgi:hypothetical protein
VGLDVLRGCLAPVVVDAEGAAFVVLGVGPGDVALAGGECFLETSMMVSSTVTDFLRKSMCQRPESDAPGEPSSSGAQAVAGNASGSHG